MRKTSLLWYNLCMIPVTMLVCMLSLERILEFRPYSSGPTTYMVIHEFSGILLFSAFSSAAGYAVRFLFFRKEEGNVQLAGVLELAAGFMVMMAIQIFTDGMYLFALIYEFFMYAAGNRCYGNSVEKNVRTSLFTFSMIMYVITGTSVYLNFRIPVYFFLVPMTAVIIMWFYLNNYKNIAVLMSTRNYDESFLPGDVRKYNRKIVSVISGIAVLVFLSYRLVTKLLMKITGKAGELLVKFLLLFDDSASETQPAASVNNGQAEDIIGEPSKISDILQILCWIFMILFTALMIYIIIKRKLVSKYLRYLRENFRKLFSSFSEDDDSDVTRGYTDILESADDEPENDSYSDMKRRWKRNYRKYQAMENGNEKFRFGYSLVQSWIRFTDRSVTHSSTPREMSAHSDISSVHDFTDRYCPVRYGDIRVTDSDCAAAGETLDTIRKQMDRFRSRKKDERSK